MISLTAKFGHQPRPGHLPVAGSGGEHSEADELSILPDYLATAGNGAWSATAASGGFLLTYQYLTYDSSENATGYSQVRQTTIDSTGTKYTGSSDLP